MRAQDLMSHPVATCHVNDTLNIAAMLMWNHDCGAVAVVRDDGKLSGMITDRDICMAAFLQGRPIDEILAHAVMATHPTSAHPDQTLDEVEQLMAEHQVRRIPVVDSENRPVGMISLNDIALESAKSETKMANGPAKVGHLLSTICKPRSPKRKAA